MRDVYVDTSAILALLVEGDSNHRKAARAFASLRENEARLVTTSYVLVEIYALLRSRIGIEAVRRFRRDFEPLLDVIWVDAGQHRAGLDRLDKAARGVSLVDTVSFVVAETQGIERAFTHDRHFAQAGLEPVR